MLRLTGNAMTKVNEVTATDNQPVTVSVSRKVVPGKERDYEAWLSGISKTSASFPGHMGINVLRPCDATKDEYVVIYRFDNYENASRWEGSEERAEWLEKVEPLVVGEATRKRVTGLEFWFDLPSIPATMVPSKHKMALILFVVVYTLVLLLSTFLAPLIGELPTWGKLLVVIPIQVLLMTYIVMPRVTSLLKTWIYSEA